MKLQELKSVMQNLVKILSCSQCGKNYEAANIHLLKKPQTEGSFVQLYIHSDCSKCHTSVLSNLVLDEGELVGATVKTDLSAEDAIKLLAKSPITADDVIGIHTQMDKFQKELVQLSKSFKRTII